MIRDQYQGGSTVMTAISGVEIAMWDLIGKASGQPVYRLIGGRGQAPAPRLRQWLVRRLHHAGRLRRTSRARSPARGYRALKFDPFTTAWKTLDADEEEHAAGDRRRGRARRSARTSA